MRHIKWVIVVSAILCASMVYADIDVTNGDVIEGYQVQQLGRVVVPENFNAEEATAAIKEARRMGDQERVRELAAQLSTWWQNNTEQPAYPDDHGYNAEAPKWNSERNNPQGSAPDWGTDVLISPNTDIYPVKIASLSNGDLYAFGVWYDGSAYHGYIRRSTDNGQNWSTYWDAAFATTTRIFSPGILVDNDTLVYWYILDHPASNEMRTWVKVCLPGTTDDPIYYGSPTGSFNPLDYSNLHLTTDAPVWGTSEYIYATWSESYGTGPDSTRVMSAVSYENDVSAWEAGPTRLAASNGANIYYTGTRTAFGSISDRMWIIAWLHPNLYPTTYDRTVKGWYSDDYGSTWSSRIDITPNNNDLDEYNCAVAASHSNTNWVVLATQDTTTTGVNQDVNCWYSTDDGDTWIFQVWISNYDNDLADVWVDDNSHAFQGACRSNSSGAEHIRYKVGSITDPTSWATSVIVNDNTTNLSDVYGPSVSYNMGSGDAILAWSDYNSAIYSIWFDSEGWTKIEELPANQVSRLNLRLAPNPTSGSARLAYSISTEGAVSITMYDAAGRLISNLASGTKPAGEYSVEIDNANLAAGIYFVKVETPDGVGTRTMTVVK
jgi:hypothetical protein